MQTLLDIAKLNADDGIVGLIESNLNVAPELATLPAFNISGTSYKTVTRVSYPQGGFRNANAGVTPGKDEFSNQIVECKFYENPMEEDLAVAKADRRGMAAYLARIADGRVKGAMQLIGKQLWYGVTGGDSVGHPGILDSYDATNMCVDATGADAGTGSSVWFLKLGEDNISFVFGQNSTFTIGDWKEQMLSSGTTRWMGIVNSIQAWVGIQFVNPKAAVRIKNLTDTTAGKGLTDLLGYKALEKFPVGMTPDVAFMTKRSRRQLQVSRSTIANAKGSSTAPLPTDICGIPIVVTDSLLNTETIA